MRAFCFRLAKVRIAGLALALSSLVAARVHAQTQINVGRGGEFATLEAALRMAADRGGDIRIAVTSDLPGEAIRITWPGRLTSLDISAASGRPVIDGAATHGGTWLEIIAAQGRPTNVSVHGLTVMNYSTAISISGARDRPEDGWNAGNRIYDMEFRNIGARGGAPPSTAVIRLVNSRGNIISDNLFIDVFNEGSCALIHAIYLAHGSSGNLVENNRIHTACMDPIRIRDLSNDNRFRNNSVEGRVPRAIYTEWFCTAGCTKPSPECPPSGNSYEHEGRIYSPTIPSRVARMLTDAKRRDARCP